MFVKILWGLFIAYGFICVFVWFFQYHLIYHPSKIANPAPSKMGLSQFQAIHIKADDGLPLQTWWAPPKAGKPVIVYFHGNAGNIADRAITIRAYLKQGYGIFLPEYRGYAGNPGKPSEAHFYADAQTALQFVQSQHIPMHCIVIYGESLGTGVATQMALDNPDAAALVLQSPISSLGAVGRAHYPFLPVHVLLREHYDNVAKIGQVNMPVLILHGNKDKVVPMKEGRKVFDAANDPKVWQYYAGGTHANLISTYHADKAVRAFIQQYVKCQ